MKRIHRIKQLNNLLRSHQGYTILDLMAKLDVGERTIRKDLEQIQQPPYNAIFSNEYRGKERLYRYKDIDFSLPMFDESDEIKAKVNETIEAIKRFEGTPQFDWLKLCLITIEKGCVLVLDDIMSFENNANLTGIENISTLADAILNKYPIKLAYQTYKAEQQQIIYVHPYHLKQFNNRWFLIGKPDNLDTIHNYAVDRIKAVEHLSKKYVESDIDFSEYFDDVIGVSVCDGPIKHIELMVSKYRYPYIKTKPLHWSQKHIKEKDTDDHILISLDVIPNRELISLLLSFGSDITVISPKEIQEIVLKNIEASLRIYKQL